jgi:hypothetical protein
MVKTGGGRRGGDLVISDLVIFGGLQFFLNDIFTDGFLPTAYNNADTFYT